MATQEEIVKVQFIVSGAAEVDRLRQEIADLNAQLVREKDLMIAAEQTMRAAGATEAQIARGTAAHAAIIAEGMRKMAAATQAMVATRAQVASTSDSMIPAPDNDTLTRSIHATGEATKHMSGKSVMALQQVGFALDDLQYGFQGIINNVQAASMSFGAWGVAVSVGVVAAYQLYRHWDDISALFGQGHTKTEAERMDELGKATARTAQETRKLAEYRRKEEVIKSAEGPTKAATELAGDVEGVLRERGPGSRLGERIAAAKEKAAGGGDAYITANMTAEERFAAKKDAIALANLQNDELAQAILSMSPFGQTRAGLEAAIHQKQLERTEAVRKRMAEQAAKNLAEAAMNPAAIEAQAQELEKIGAHIAAGELRASDPVEKAIAEGEKERQRLNETLFDPEVRRKRIEDATAGPPAELGRAPREKAMDELVSDIQSETGLNQIVAGDIKEAQARKWLEALGLDPTSIENYLPDVLGKLQAIGRKAVDEAVANSERERERVNADLERMAEAERAKRLAEATDLAREAADTLQGNLPGLSQDVKNAMLADIVGGRGQRRNRVGLMETVRPSLDMSSSRAASILSKQIQEERPGVGPMEAMAEARKIVERERRNILAEGRQALESMQDRSARGIVPGKGIQMNTLMGEQAAMQTAREGVDKQWWDLTREAAKAQIYLAEMTRRNPTRHATVAPRR